MGKDAVGWHSLADDRVCLNVVFAVDVDGRVSFGLINEFDLPITLLDFVGDIPVPMPPEMYMPVAVGVGCLLVFCMFV